MVPAHEGVVGLARRPDVRGRAQDGQREIAAELAGQLGRAADARVGVAGADAPGIEEVEVGMLEGPGALDEEGPLLVVEGLERREVQHCGIRLHLPEVGLEGGVQGQVRSHPVLEIRAEILVVLPGVPCSRRRRVGVLGDRVGQDLELAGAVHILQSDQGPPAADEAAGHAVPGHPAGVFPASMQPAIDLQAPGHVRGGFEADGGEGHADLHVPAPVVPLDLGLPHCVPVAVTIPVVEQVVVLHHPLRVDPEVVAGGAVEVGVDVHADQVGGLDRSAAAQVARHQAHVVFPAGDPEIDGVLVVGHLEGGGDRRRPSPGRLVLLETPTGLRQVPRGIVQSAVHHDLKVAQGQRCDAGQGGGGAVSRGRVLGAVPDGGEAGDRGLGPAENAGRRQEGQDHGQARDSVRSDAPDGVRSDVRGGTRGAGHGSHLGSRHRGLQALR